MIDRTKERRIRRYHISAEEIIYVFTAANKLSDCHFIELHSAEYMPPDAEVVDAYYAPERRCFALLVWSASFEIVEDGRVFPTAPEGDRFVKVAALKRRSFLDTHEPATPADAQLIAEAQASWRDRKPLL